VDQGVLNLDQRIRVASFAIFTEQTQRTPDGVLPRTALATGFTFDGTRVPLIGPQGIFKPAIFPEMPLSITTAPASEAGLLVAVAIAECCRSPQQRGDWRNLA
jgi:hypothetical protein